LVAGSADAGAAGPAARYQGRVIVEEIVAGLREVIRRHRVTYAEYRGALHFLTQTVEQNELPLLSDVLLEAVVDEAEHPVAEGTDTNVEGPFYVAGAPLLDADGGTPVLPMRPEEPGDRLLFTGAVRSTAGPMVSSRRRARRSSR